jgi:hypothetical protein
MRRLRNLLSQRRIFLGLTLAANIAWLMQGSRDAQLRTLLVSLIVGFLAAGGVRAAKRLQTALMGGRWTREAVSTLIIFTLLVVKALVIRVWWSDETVRLDPLVGLVDTLTGGLLFASFRLEVNPQTLEQIRRITQKRVSALLDGRVTSTGRFIELDKQNRPDLVIPLPSATPPTVGTLEIGVPLKDILFRANNRLLILGAAGSGKTTAVYHLAAQLLAHPPVLSAKDSDSTLNETAGDVQSPPQQIPIIVDLTAWARKQQDLETWLVEELQLQQGIGRQVSLPLLRGSEGVPSDVLLLLDGLDEMKTEAMKQCLAELNNFLLPKDTSIARPGLVVTCRFEEYEAAQLSPRLRLPLNNAVVIQPLNKDQIEAYLSVRHSSFQIASEYVEILSKPLMLYAVVRVAETTPDILDEVRISNPQSEHKPTLNKEDKETLLFQRYIDHAIQEYTRLRTDPRFRQASSPDPKLVRGQLGWLARHMRDEKFLLDDIQPRWLLKASAGSWLNPSFMSWLIVYLLATRTTLALVVAFGAGLFVADPFENIAAALYAAAFVTVFDLGRFAFFARQSSRRERAGKERLKVSRTARVFRGAIGFSTVFLGVGTILSLHFGVSDLYRSPDIQPFEIAGLELSIAGITRGFYLALFFGTYLGVGRTHQTLDTDVGTIDELSPAWSSAILRGLTWAVIIGSVIGLAAFLLYNAPENQQSRIWLQDVSNVTPFGDTPEGYATIGLAVGAVAGFCVGLIFGSFRIEDLVRDRVANPDRSLGMSFRYALQLTLIFGLFFAVVLSALTFLITSDVDSIVRGTMMGIGIGILTLPYYGGMTLINFMVLRIIFYIRGLPYRFLSRLDTLKKTTLIQRRDRGYVFYHKRVYEYFKYQEPLVFEEQLQPQRMAQVLVIMCLIVVTIGLARFMNGAIYGLGVPQDAMFVTHQGTEAIVSDFCLSEGEVALIRSRGTIRSGAYVGYIPPEGTEVGVFGLPIRDPYDIVPEIAHSALMCRIVGTGAWSHCANSSSIVPYHWRSTVFTAHQSGCLEFAINDNEPSGHLGGFWVAFERDALGDE